ncbi:N-acetylneuraminate synthase (EC [Olavius sp. associated proteobacterium Delta 1]|nr:N-acetylneuraminate synthase (EC [Olavius sp. associated proteobacterium Delta 1]
MQHQVKIIAEIGSNYNGDLDLAKKYISAAAQCGADMVKFQTLRKDQLIAPKVTMGGGLKDNPVYQNFANLELPDAWHFSLQTCANQNHIEFFSTPFYLEAVELLERVGIATYKIASGDITFIPLLKAVGKTGKDVILSTGGSNLADVESALNVLTDSGAGNITLLHCVSSYPPRFAEMNLKAIGTLKNVFDLPVGISDHTPGSLVPIAAVAMGAGVVEKHVTFDRALPGPDHPFAMTMAEFAEMVEQIRLLELALGTGEKIPSDDELSRQHRFRRGVYDQGSYQPVNDHNGIWLRPEHRCEF